MAQLRNGKAQTSKAVVEVMDFDATIERLNALKLQEKHTAFVPQQPPSTPHKLLSSVPLSSQQSSHSIELRRLQEEYERRTQEQERQLQKWQQEMHDLRVAMEAMQQQNQLLRAAVGTLDTYKQQVVDQQQTIEELQNQVKHLRLTNYRLQYVAQQNEPRGHSSFMPPPPPDIF